MSGQQSIGIEKTLHQKDAFVQSVHYISTRNPTLLQTITIGDRVTVGSYGKTAIWVSEDNGKAWTDKGEWNSLVEQVDERTIRRGAPCYYLDAEHGILIEFYGMYEEGPAGFYTDFGPDQEGAPLQARTGRLFYRFSRDEGKTWGPVKQLIQKGDEYDEVHWGDGMYYGRNSAYSIFTPIKLRDGAIILQLCFNVLNENGKLIKWPDRFSTTNWPIINAASLRGTWRDDLSDIDWEMSNHISIPQYMSRSLTEPEIAELENGNLMVIMRGNNSGWQALPGVKFFSISRDGGRTWGPAAPLTYPDASFVNSPGSYPNLFRSSKNGRVYIIANILPEPCRHCDPRYPLKIAEIDQDYFWVLPETETVIQDREQRHGKCIRFSNWRRFEDRETGNPVIFMTEARVDAIIPDPEEQPIVPDSYRYEMILPD